MKTETIASSKTLQIDGMHGDVCVQKVTAALKAVPGVTTKSVAVGTAVIEADQAGCDAACAAINKAGFKSHAKAWDKSADKAHSADGKMADGKMADGKLADGKASDGKMTDGKMADGRPTNTPKLATDDKTGNPGNGHNQNQKSGNDHANAGNANKAVEPKPAAQPQPAKSH